MSNLLVLMEVKKEESTFDCPMREVKGTIDITLVIVVGELNTNNRSLLISAAEKNLAIKEGTQLILSFHFNKTGAADTFLIKIRR